MTGFELLAIGAGLYFIYEMTKLIVNRNRPAAQEDKNDEV